MTPDSRREEEKAKEFIVLASISSTLTSWISENGVYAVFALMGLDALLPVGGELVMLYAGVLAGGQVTGHGTSLFGIGLSNGLESYLVLSAAGTLGYLLGACAGWALGRSGGRTILTHSRWLHLSDATLVRAESWFDRFGPLAVLLGRITPVVRSFISIPAGILRTPFATYVPLTLIGSAIWCFAFAGGGWALGGSWRSFHDNFRYADYVGVVLVLAGVAILLVRRGRVRRAT